MLNTDGFFLGLLLNGKLDSRRGLYELAPHTPRNSGR